FRPGVACARSSRSATPIRPPFARGQRTRSRASQSPSSPTGTATERGESALTCLSAPPRLVLRARLIAQWVVLPQVAAFGQLQSAKLFPFDVLGGLRRELRREGDGNDDRAVVVGDDNVARHDRDPATRDRNVHG